MAAAALAAAAGLFPEHEGGRGRGDDPTHVHQARVATRRLRSHLRVFGEVFDAEWAAGQRRELRWLGRLLGAARGPDVLAERLTGHIEQLPVVDHPAVETILDRLRAQRARAGIELAAALRGYRYETLRGALVAAPRTAPSGALHDAQASLVLPPLVERPWKRLRRRVARLGDDPTDEALHAVRIATKRCRYTSEAVAPVIGEPAQRFADALRRLQNRLGEHQDAVDAESWLRSAAAQGAPDAAFVAGELAAMERRAARRARASWPRAWRTVFAARLQ